MHFRTGKVVKALGILVLAFSAITAYGIYRLDKTEETCWEQEAAAAFQKYGSHRTRAEILQAAYIDTDPGTNPVEVIEKDPNGCSLGSNGQTVIRFSFDDSDNLKRIQVYRNYIAADYEMTLIDERRY